ncbi:MAG TPA: hypothetical protein VHA05_03515 [Candidatus Saccharimonadales bacterium]|nr:hypothetical protein [Candidatus Saccharimonadales bacterium]
MEVARHETDLGVAGWNTSAATALLMDEDTISSLRLASLVKGHIELEPAAASDENFVGFLVLAHDFYLQKQDYKQAHAYGVKLYHMGREDVGAPLLYESAYLLALEELGKATAALNDKKYRRASDKGVWSAIHFGDAIRAGRIEAQDEFYTAAGVAIEANALYGGSTEAIEAHIFDDCEEFGIPPPVDIVRAARLRIYDEALKGDKYYRAKIMLNLALGLNELGQEIPGLTRLAAVLGIRDYLTGRTDNFPDEYFEVLEADNFPKEAMADLMLAAKHKEYDINLSGSELNSVNDVAVWPWFRAARICVDLIRLGDESGKEKLVYALERQVEAIDVNYFWLADGYGVEVHFDSYVDAGLISDAKCQDLKQVLRERFVKVRQQFTDGLEGPIDEYNQAIVDRIDRSIVEYT